MASGANIDMYITDELDSEKFTLQWNAAKIGVPTDPVTLRLHNGETLINTSTNLLMASRADMMISAFAGEDSDVSNVMGQELIDESWLEARLGIAGAWTALNGWSSKLDLGAVLAGAYVTFQVRLNIPVGATTIGAMGFCFGLRTA